MDGGEILTSVTIWITFIAYAAGASLFALSRNRDRTARLLWTIASVSLLAHIASAFHFYHHWSHSAAYRDTARQTYEMFGINWGAGVYLNYALLVFWLVDVGWWWRGGLDKYRRRSWLLVVAWHGLLLFMFFNATVVFGTGLIRWVGLVMCLGLCLAWWIAWRRSHERGKAGNRYHRQTAK